MACLGCGCESCECGNEEFYYEEVLADEKMRLTEELMEGLAEPWGNDEADG